MLRALVLAPLLAASASAQTVAGRVTPAEGVVAPVGLSGSVLPASSLSTFDSSLLSPSMSLTPSLAPSVSEIALQAPSAVAVIPSAFAVAVRPAASKASFAAGVPVVAVKPSAAIVPTAFKPAAAFAASKAAVSAVAETKAAEQAPKLDALFDGAVTKAASVSDPVAVREAPAPKSALLRFVRKAASSAAATLVLTPTAAFAGEVAAQTTLPLVETWHPVAVAVASVLGVLFGLWSARAKDGSPANSGAVFAASMSYGAVAGAAVYALLDLTKLVFTGGAAIGLVPLAGAVAIAALAQTAFAQKFVDPASTPADRIMGAFPAVAACFGLTVGVASLSAAPTLLTVASAFLAVTGAAAALYTALFRPERSPADGPAAMGRGFTLQVLMSGLGLALAGSPWSWFFFALGAWGFGLVMLATAREVASAVKAAKTPPKP